MDFPLQKPSSYLAVSSLERAPLNVWYLPSQGGDAPTVVKSVMGPVRGFGARSVSGGELVVVVEASFEF